MNEPKPGVEDMKITERIKIAALLALFLLAFGVVGQYDYEQAKAAESVAREAK